MLPINPLLAKALASLALAAAIFAGGYMKGYSSGEQKLYDYVNEQNQKLLDAYKESKEIADKVQATNDSMNQKFADFRKDIKNIKLVTPDCKPTKEFTDAWNAANRPTK